MSRKISHFGNVTVLNPTHTPLRDGPLGKLQSPAGKTITAWTHQAANLRRRLRDLYLAGDEKAGRAMVSADRRLMRRTLLRQDILLTETKVRASKIIRAADLVRAAQASTQAEVG